ncbi:MAG: hypothetical protein KJ645_10095 [Planctomycetes bacterium]|nr:hypothetical protein [Planctomycetota bacterium]
MQNLTFSMMHYKIDPYLLWSTVTESGMEKLIFDMYFNLSIFPYEQV